MPFDLAELSKKSAHVDVEVRIGADVQTIAVDYRPDKYTLGTVHMIQNLSGEDQVDRLADILKDLLVSWDITEDGTALMVSDATLRRLPMMVLNAILRGIAGDVGDLKNGHRR